MNTGSMDERQMLANVTRIAAALERIAASLEATALREYGPAPVRGYSASAPKTTAAPQKEEER